MKVSFSGLALLLCIYCVSGADIESCDGAEVALRSTVTAQQAVLQWGFVANFSTDLPSQESQPLLLRAADPADACSQLNTDINWTGTAVLVERGSCYYGAKAARLVQANASAIVIYNNETGCLIVGANDTVSPQIMAVSTTLSGGSVLLEAAAAGGSLTLWAPPARALDPSAILIWLVAVGTAVASSLWAGSDFAAELRAASVQQDAASSSAGKGKAKTEPTVEVLTVTGASAVGFVVVSSSMLLIMYFFLSRTFFIVLVTMFCLAAFQAVASAIAALFTLIWPGPMQHPCVLPLLGEIPVSALAASLPAAVIVGVWAVFQDSAWAWVLQDLMGMALMVLILRQFRLPNVQVASTLLPMCFLYDIFWVFIQPMLTHGTSVMVEVATGGEAHERMPMLVLVPRLWGPPGYTMLGFGDVVLPGLLLVYTRVYDLANVPAPGKGERGVWGGYFAPAAAGYGFGLLCTYAALLLELGGNQGQPALLYLIPCTLGLVIFLAWRRGHLPVMWRGNVTEAAMSRLCKDSDAESQADVEEGLEAQDSDEQIHSSSRRNDEASSLLPEPRSQEVQEQGT